MKNTLLLLSFLATSIAWCAKPNVIPELRQWADTPDAKPFTLTADTRVVIPENACPELERYAQTFAQDIQRECVREASSWWRSILFMTEKAQPGDILLKVFPEPEKNQEGYQLVASDAGVTITAPTALGAFWGTRTLLQVLDNQDNTFPAGVADDWPRYSVRGFLFDCGRKPFTLTTLRQIVKICSYYKLNDLQLHLNDNYIWLHNYPGVKTAEDVLNFEPSPGAFRLESQVKGLTSTDLSYSKEEFRALVEEAQGLGVKIIPELDVPGHALALVRVRPDLMYKGSVGNKHDLERAAMLDLSNPETLPFVKSIFDEYIDSDIFQQSVVHIGTDEYYGDAESFRKFNDAMIRYIQSKGKTPRFWGSLSTKRGKTPVTPNGNAQMHIWSLGWQNPREALEQGFDIINILDSWVYVVPSGTGSVGPYGDDIDARRLYEHWTPENFFNQSVDANNPHLLGGAWAMWNDNAFLTDPGLCGRDLLPNIQKNCAVVAQKTWNTSKAIPYPEFEKTFKAQAATLEATKPAAWSLTYTVTLPEGEAPVLLASGDETDLYAVSPVNGKVGFRREGAQYTFDVTLPKGEPVTLTFHSANRETWISVNGKKLDLKPVRQHHNDALRYCTLPIPTNIGEGTQAN